MTVDSHQELAIQARGLSRNFGTLAAVSALDLIVEKKIIYGFLGPNGSGKTTAIRNRKIKKNNES
jgi:ABC-2 type transport system ATP-binding protein